MPCVELEKQWSQTDQALATSVSLSVTETMHIASGTFIKLTWSIYAFRKRLLISTNDGATEHACAARFSRLLQNLINDDRDPLVENEFIFNFFGLRTCSN